MSAFLTLRTYPSVLVASGRTVRVAALVILAACGGNGSSGGPTGPSGLNFEGMWTGLTGSSAATVFNGATVNTFIFSDGSYWFLYNDASSPSLVFAFDHGTQFPGPIGDNLYFVTGIPCSIPCGGFRLSTVFNQTIDSASISGSSPTLAVLFGGSSFATKQLLTYNSAYKTTPTLGVIANSWHGTAAFWVPIAGSCSIGALCGDNFSPAIAFNITSSGTLSGVSGCIDSFYNILANCSTISGTVTPRSDGYAYNATFTVAAVGNAPVCGQAGCILPFSSPETFTGVAYYNSTTQLITIAGINTTKAQAVTFTGQAGPGPAAKLGFQVQPTSDTAGGVLTPAIQVGIQDAVGNILTAATNSVTLAIGTNPGTGTLSGTTSAAAVNGVATFSTLSINKAGTGYTLVASATGLTGATSAPFNITAGSPANLAFSVQPSSALEGQALSPAVQVAIQDARANTVTGATNSVAVAIGTNPVGGTLSGTTTVAAVNGVATFSTLSIDKGGSAYTLVASASGLTGATSAAFQILHLWSVISASHYLVSFASGGGGGGCGLTTAGVAYCWGPSSTTPGSPVSSSLTFQSISAGWYHDCALTSAGVAYCWGDNTYGELGNGTTTGSTTPGAVSGSLTFQSISAGLYDTCGLTSAGAAYCWGLNTNGQLGNGTTTDSHTPVAVSGGYTFGSITTGGGPTTGSFACGVTTTGTGYCWGSNSNGQLGNGTNSSSAAPVAVSGGLTFQAIRGGGYCTSGLTSGGAPYAWGGCLGYSSTTPLAVGGSVTLTSISAGFYHTCGVTSGGTGYCWGDNNSGELGDGSGSQGSTTPVAVSGGLTFRSISAGGNYTCGVTTLGAGYCWGLGTNRNVPAPW